MSATDRINALGAWIDRGLEWDAAEAMSGDYDNVLRTAMRWVETA